MNDLISQMEEYASNNNVPIMQKDGIEFLLDFIKNNNIKSVLEIGTAIGYSSIRIASIETVQNVTTIERDKERYLIAQENIEASNVSSKIETLLCDAMDVVIDEKYDLIFIDAAKGKNIDFFEKFSKNLNPGGYIITDNLNFHGMVEKEIESIESRNVRGLVRKIRLYIEYLKNNEDFETTFYQLGDGISVSRMR